MPSECPLHTTRGQVKKALKANDGSFRATFEDKVRCAPISIRSRYDLVVLLATDGLPCMRALTTTRARLSVLRSDLVVLRAVMTSDDL